MNVIYTRRFDGKYETCNKLLPSQDLLELRAPSQSQTALQTHLRINIAQRPRSRTKKLTASQMVHS
jgi:hypothetical protein